MAFVSPRRVAFEGAIEAQNAPSGGLSASPGDAGLAGVLQKGLGARKPYGCRAGAPGGALTCL